MIIEGLPYTMIETPAGQGRFVQRNNAGGVEIVFCESNKRVELPARLAREERDAEQWLPLVGIVLHSAHSADTWSEVFARAAAHIRAREAHIAEIAEAVADHERD